MFYVFTGVGEEDGSLSCCTVAGERLSCNYPCLDGSWATKKLPLVFAAFYYRCPSYLARISTSFPAPTLCKDL